MIGCACFWVVAMMVPELLHLEKWQCLLVYAHALALLASSPHWRMQLFFSMAVGRAIGYAALGPFLQANERLRCEKDRISFDFMLAMRKMHSAPLKGSRCGESSSHGTSSGSNGSCSELAELLAASGVSPGEARGEQRFASSLVSRGRTLGSRTSGAGSGAQTGPLNIFDPSDVEIFDEQTKARLDSTLRMR